MTKTFIFYLYHLAQQKVLEHSKAHALLCVIWLGLKKGYYVVCVQGFVHVFGVLFMPSQ